MLSKKKILQVYKCRYKFVTTCFNTHCFSTSIALQNVIVLHVFSHLVNQSYQIIPVNKFVSAETTMSNLPLNLFLIQIILFRTI